MAEDDLKSFLREQARSLDSLLELTPARNMFGEDVSDQWKRKKQTPEQKKAARMAKLDPANWKSAKDVYDERSAEAARKRKRESSGGAKAITTNEALDATAETQLPSKKRKIEDPTNKAVITGRVGETENPDDIANKNLKKKIKKRANRGEKNQEIREKKEKKKVEKAAQRTEPSASDGKESPPKREQMSKKPGAIIAQPKQDGVATSTSVKSKSRNEDQMKTKPTTKKSQRSVISKDEQRDKLEQKTGTPAAGEKGEDGWSDIEEDTLDANQNGFAALDTDADKDEIMEDAISTADSSDGMPDILSPPQDSAASSVSSIIPPPNKQSSTPSKSTDEIKDTTNATTKTGLQAKPVQSEAERSAARQRLQEQISQFRSQRKADDRPVRSRAELLEQRRRTEAEKKATKKEQRKKQKEEEAKLQDEEMARRFSPGGSGSLLASPRSPIVDLGSSESFTFGRIAFEDGTQLDPTTLSAVAGKKQKGASDPASALKAAQAKSARIAGLDEDKKQDIQEKDMWLNARKRAHGERVKDDTSLLKKALKRQEKQKQRSGKDWDERTEGVRASQEAKQKRRTENLQKRKDEKSGKKPAKKVKRPGFEGSFKSRTGKSKK